MALTEAVRLRLEGNDFGPLYADNQPVWSAMAEQARALMAGQMDHAPTVDDIHKALFPLLEINPILRAFLQLNKLTQKYWIKDFTDYVLDRLYNPILHLPGGG